LISRFAEDIKRFMVWFVLRLGTFIFKIGVELEHIRIFVDEINYFLQLMGREMHLLVLVYRLDRVGFG
jgi:hypothetical protein